MEIKQESTSDWYISNQACVWNVVKNDGTDAFSVNIAENIDYKAMALEYSYLSFYEFKKIVETQWKCDFWKYAHYII